MKNTMKTRQNRKPAPWARLLMSMAGLFPAAVVAQVNYALSADGSFAYVTNSPSCAGAVTVGDLYQGRPVAMIGNGAFADCSNLTSIKIPSGVTRIGDMAFSWCTRLQEVVLPASVASIGTGAFMECRDLRGILLPPAITSIATRTFSGCSSLDFIALPQVITRIDTSAFSGCSALSGIAIPDGVTRIGDWTFAWCSRLKAIAIPATVSSIGPAAFYECLGLQNITIPPGIRRIESSAFNGCSGLSSVTLPATVTSIGDAAFYSCHRLASIEVPPGVTSVGERAFGDCSNLAEAVFWGNLPSIGPFAFQSVSPNAVVHYLPRSSPWPLVLGGLPTRAMAPVDYAVGPDDSSAYVTNSPASAGAVRVRATYLGRPVRKIGDGAFRGCSGLTNLVFPDSVVAFGNDAFAGCSGMINLVIPGAVASIGDGAFKDCTRLARVIFGGNAPLPGNDPFPNVAPGFAAYYMSGTSGWGPAMGGRPTRMFPEITTFALTPSWPSALAVFTVKGSVGDTVLLEATDNLNVWLPVSTQTLGTPSVTLSDPQSIWFGRRFYRVRLP